MSHAHIAGRKALLPLTAEDESLLARQAEAVKACVEKIVAGFYGQMMALPAVARIIGSPERLEQLHGTLARYVLRLFSGAYDVDYAKARLRMGKVHARNGVPPHLFISALHRLELQIDAHLADTPDKPAILLALRRLLHFDLQLVMDAYIEAIVADAGAGESALAAHIALLEARLAERTAEVAQMVHTDALSGLFNRNGFFDCLHKQAAMAAQRGAPLSLLFLDIDDLKVLNDTLGHIAGDRAIAAVGAAIRATGSGGDLAFRYGGDEFCLILPDTDEETARARLRAIRAALAPKVEISGGVAAFGPKDLHGLDAFVARADQAMYGQKSTRRDIAS